VDSATHGWPRMVARSQRRPPQARKPDGASAVSFFTAWLECRRRRACHPDRAGPGGGRLRLRPAHDGCRPSVPGDRTWVLWV